MNSCHALIVGRFADSNAPLRRACECVFEGARISHVETLRGGLAQLNSVPQMILTKLHLPDGSGLELIAQSHAVLPATKVLVVSVFDDAGHIFSALRAGACGYLLHDERQENLSRHLLAAMNGELTLSPKIAEKVMHYFSTDTACHHSGHLTRKELKVLGLLGAGLTIEEVAERLGISFHTAHGHTRNIYAKFAISTRAEAANIATRLGLNCTGA
ncbi:MAG: LuxR C-terminal-related transcriptional regulator [Stenotrophobium sp.]